ncbi:HAUS augmin-like complex subunit [Wolffia australiana]
MEGAGDGLVGSPARADAARISEVKAWLAAQFEAVGRDVPDFEYTPRSVAHLHAIASLSQARSRAASIVASDLRQKASEYRSQAVRVGEILESVGLAQERLSSDAIEFAEVIASVANLLNIRDTEISSFMVAVGELSMRRDEVGERREKIKKESKLLLGYTRKAIAKLNELKKIVAKFDNEVLNQEAQMDQWQTNLSVLESKERQYKTQSSNYEAVLKRVGYTAEINHGVLMEMAEQRKELEKKTKPILETLRSYQDLPPDKALAALAIEEKKRQCAAAEKHLEDVLQSAI